MLSCRSRLAFVPMLAAVHCTAQIHALKFWVKGGDGLYSWNSILYKLLSWQLSKHAWMTYWAEGVFVYTLVIVCQLGYPSLLTVCKFANHYYCYYTLELVSNFFYWSDWLKIWWSYGIPHEGCTDQMAGKNSNPKWVKLHVGGRCLIFPSFYWMWTLLLSHPRFGLKFFLLNRLSSNLVVT